MDELQIIIAKFMLSLRDNNVHLPFQSIMKVRFNGLELEVESCLDDYLYNPTQDTLNFKTPMDDDFKPNKQILVETTIELRNQLSSLRKQRVNHG